MGTRLRNREDTNSLSDKEEYKHKPTKEEEGTEDSEKTKRMSLMTLFAGPTQPTHLDRSLHDLMFAPTSCRSRCGSGSLARRSSFSRRFSLPDDADESSIHAQQKDGVVTISIGKAAPSAPRVRHIPVSSLADGSGVPPSPGADAVGTAGPGEAPQHDGDTAHADA